MKKHIYAFSAIASAILMAAGCQMAELELETVPGTDNLELNEESEGGNYSVTFDCYQEMTRTEFHENTIWWSAGDVLIFGQYTKIDGAWKMKTVSNVGLTESKPAMSLNVSSFNTPSTDTTTAYFSVYPKSAYMGYASDNGIPVPRIAIKKVQCPNASNFDPEADILVSEAVTSQADTAMAHIKLKYTRPGALAKMSVINLPSSDAIASIKFTAVAGGQTAVLSGCRYYDILKGEPAPERNNGNCNDVNDITLDYSNCEISGDMTAYFTCYPFELVEGDIFTVVVTTKEGDSYTKFVTLGADDKLSFKSSLATRFTVDMASSIATGVSWCDIEVYEEGINNLNYKVVGEDIAEYTRAAYKRSSWLALTPEQQSSKLDSAKVGTIGKGVNLTGCAENTDYIIAAKVKNTAGQTAIIMKPARTSWANLKAATRSSGGIQAQVFCKTLAYGTKTWITVKTSELEGITDLEQYYMSLSPKNLAQSTIDAINAKAGEAAAYAVIKDYKEAELVPDESYTVMMKAVSTTGQIKFMAIEGIAK